MRSLRHPQALETGVRIVIADHNKEIRSALGLLLRETGVRAKDTPAPCQRTILEATGAGDVVRHLEEAYCDVILLDWELPGLSCGELIAEIRRLAPGCKLLVMSGRPEAYRHSKNLGIDGFVSKSEPPDGLLELLGMS
jgi:two-component system response regulator DesR